MIIKKHLLIDESVSFKNYSMVEIVQYHHPNEYFMMILFSKKLFSYFQKLILINFIIIAK